jgi:hypothetical protein
LIQEDLVDNSLANLKDEIRFKLQKTNQVKSTEKLHLDSSSERLSFKNRQIAQQVFHTWLEFHNDRKKAWEKLIRLIYRREQARLSQIMFEMKLYSRNKKIMRLKYTLCSHNHYRFTTKFVMMQL